MDSRTRERILHKARLDGGFPFPKGGQGYFDVHIVDAYTTNATDRRQRSREAGAAAREGVSNKFEKYPPEKHPRATLKPFVLEALGRPSDEALDLLKTFAPTDPSERSLVLKAAGYRLSTLLAMRNAELLLTAEGQSLGRPARRAKLGAPSSRLVQPAGRSAARA